MSEKPKYEVRENAENHELKIYRTEDDKLIADVEPVEGDESALRINPVAPTYHREEIMSELEETLEAFVNKAPEEEKPEVPAVKPKESQPSSNPPKAGPLGDRDPEFIEWLYKTNPDEAAKRYAGKNVETYESLIK